MLFLFSDSLDRISLYNVLLFVSCCASVEPADSEQGDVAMETVRSESHSNLNGMANNAQGGRVSLFKMMSFRS